MADEHNSDVGEGGSGAGGIWTFQDILAEEGYDYESLDEPMKGLMRRRAKTIARNRNNQVKKGRENRVAEEQEEFTQATDPFSTDPEQIEARNRAMGMLDPDDLDIYGANDTRRFVTPQELMAGVNHQESPWEDSRSSFGDLGPSAWTVAESAYGDLEFDQDSLDGMGRSAMYFDDLRADGTDDISEADYQRRVADAEQVRRANLESAIQSAEMKGQGGVGDRLLAELSGAQASTSDIYQAGLDANAMAAARRDSAAMSGADIYDRMGGRIFDADAARSQGLDTFTGKQNDAFDDFNATVAKGKDDFTDDRNDGLQDWMGTETQNWLDVQRHNAGIYGDVADRSQDREWDVNDANTEGRNKILGENSAKQERLLGAHMGSLGMEGGQVLGQGNLDLNRTREQNRHNEATDPWGKIMDVINLGRGVAKDVKDEEED